MRRFRPALLLVLAFALAGCSKTYKIRVESDTSWQAEINRDLRIDGSGDQTYKVKGALDEVSATKRTDTGTLRLRVDDGRPAETTEPFGTVTIRP